MVVVGNSTMRDLFFRQNVYSIGQTPYRSITEIEMAEGKRTTTSLEQSGLRSLLPIHPRARVYGAPIISGMWARTLQPACWPLTWRMNAADRDHGHRHEHGADCRQQGPDLAASCPAGPAFEGGAITCGMPALEGRLRKSRLRTIGSFRLG